MSRDDGSAMRRGALPEMSAEGVAARAAEIEHELHVASPAHRVHLVDELGELAERLIGRSSPHDLQIRRRLDQMLASAAAGAPPENPQRSSTGRKG